MLHCSLFSRTTDTFNPILPEGFLAPPLEVFAHNSEREKDNSTKFGEFS